MAGDDNEAKADASKSADKPADLAPVAQPPGSSPPVSEWTASDARGPLNEARPLPDAPAPETCAIAGDETAAPIAGPAINETATESVKPTPPLVADVPRRKASLMPVAAGIVLGALIGAGSAYYVYTSAGTDADQKLAALTGRVDSLDKRGDATQAIAPLKASLADLSTKVAAATADAQAAKKAVQAQAPATVGQGQPASGQMQASAPPSGADVSALREKLAALANTVSLLQNQGQQAASSSDLKAAQEKLSAVDTSVSGLKTQLSDIQKQAATLDSQIAALQKQDTVAQGDVQALRAGQKSLEGKITSAPALAVVADSLVERINRGLPFVTQVNALESLGIDPTKIAVLRLSADQGVPSAKALADSFEPLTDGLLTTSVKPVPNAGFWDRMKNGMGGLVSVHKAGDVTGDDVPSRVAAVKANLAHGDVIAAVAVWNSLPAEVKSKPDAAAWGALAKTHADAIAAANAIETSAIASLGPKKS